VTDRDFPGPLGPDPYDPAVRRKNLKTMAVVAVAMAILVAIPMTYRRVVQPEQFYATHAQAVTAQAVERGDVPTFVPATATEIHARNNRDSGQRFVRFTFVESDIPAITRGMRRMPRAEVEKVLVPAPGWSEWFPITSRTLSGTQGGYLHVYEIASGPDRGYLAVDPRTRYAYFWSRPARRS
jgi:thioesterase domain-containing protein